MSIVIILKKMKDSNIPLAIIISAAKACSGGE